MRTRIARSATLFALLAPFVAAPLRANRMLAYPGQDTLAATPTDPGWPRTFSKEGTTVVVHQPQVDEWKDHETIHFRAALEVTPAGAKQASYGVAEAEATTDVVPTNE